MATESTASMDYTKILDDMIASEGVNVDQTTNADTDFQVEDHDLDSLGGSESDEFISTEIYDQQPMREAPRFQEYHGNGDDSYSQTDTEKNSEKSSAYHDGETDEDVSEKSNQPFSREEVRSSTQDDDGEQESISSDRFSEQSEHFSESRSESSSPEQRMISPPKRTPPKPFRTPRDPPLHEKNPPGTPEDFYEIPPEGRVFLSRSPPRKRPDSPSQDPPFSKTPESPPYQKVEEPLRHHQEEHYVPSRKASPEYEHPQNNMNETQYSENLSVSGPRTAEKVRQENPQRYYEPQEQPSFERWEYQQFPNPYKSYAGNPYYQIPQRYGPSGYNPYHSGYQYGPMPAQQFLPPHPPQQFLPPHPPQQYMPPQPQQTPQMSGNSEEVLNLKQTVLKLQTEKEDLNHSFMETTKLLGVQENNIRSLNGVIQEKDIEIRETYDRYHEILGKVNLLEKQKNALKKGQSSAVQDLENQLQDSQAANSSLHAELRTLTTQMERLKAESQENLEWKKKYNDLKASVQEIEESKVKTDHKLSAAEQSNDRYQKKVKQLTTEKEQLQSRINDMELQKSDDIMLIKELKTKLQKKSEAFNNANNEVAIIKQKLHHQIEENKKVSADLENLRSNNSNLKTRVEDIQHTNQSDQKTLRQVLAENDSMNREIQKLKRDISHLSQENDLLIQQNQTLHETVEDLQNQSKNIRKSRESTRSDLSRANREIDNLMMKIEDLEAKLQFKSPSNSVKNSYHETPPQKSYHERREQSGFKHTSYQRSHSPKYNQYERTKVQPNYPKSPRRSPAPFAVDNSSYQQTQNSYNQSPPEKKSFYSNEPQRRYSNDFVEEPPKRYSNNFVEESKIHSTTTSMKERFKPETNDTPRPTNTRLSRDSLRPSSNRLLSPRELQQSPERETHESPYPSFPYQTRKTPKKIHPSPFAKSDEKSPSPGEQNEPESVKHRIPMKPSKQEQSPSIRESRTIKPAGKPSHSAKKKTSSTPKQENPVVVPTGIPFATEQSIENQIQQTAKHEKELMTLSLEQNQLNGELQRLYNAKNTISNRRRKAEIEERLEEIQKQRSALRMKLRNLNVI